MFNVVIDYLPEDDEVAVIQRTTSLGGEKIATLFTGEDVLAFHAPRPQGADRRGSRALRRADRRGHASAPARHAGLRQ
ncbi:MAG: hypothetical protein WDN28_07370 [Chthoniobacter sp.]